MSTVRPKVSVIIPAYNVEQWIAAKIDSVLKQTRSDWEVIVVDDGSTDSTPEIVRALDEPRVRLVTQSNQGPTSARNTGFEEAQGDYVALHRPATSTFSPPQMWVARSRELIDWGRHQHLAGGVYDWEGGRVGAGPPPIRTDEGWLEIHHGSVRANRGGTGAYAGGAMLLDLEDPGRVLRRSADPILVPETDYELHGFVGSVVFPTGVVETGETLLIYYGAADTASAVVELSLREVLEALE